jgi:hypothetical protein
MPKIILFKCPSLAEELIIIKSHVPPTSPFCWVKNIALIKAVKDNEWPQGDHKSEIKCHEKRKTIFMSKAIKFQFWRLQIAIHGKLNFHGI